MPMSVNGSTVTTVFPHGIAAGTTDWVNIPAGSNNPFQITNVGSTTTFTVTPAPLAGSNSVQLATVNHKQSLGRYQPFQAYNQPAPNPASQFRHQTATAMGINPFPPVVPKTPPGASESAKGGIITITDGVHGFAVGQTVKIYNVSNNGYNGTATIATVPEFEGFHVHRAPERARPAAPSGRRLRFQRETNLPSRSTRSCRHVRQTYSWLTHIDQPPINVMELLHVSAFRPHQLTQATNNGALYQQYAPWNPYVGTQSATTIQQALIYRGSGPVQHAQSHMNGDHRRPLAGTHQHQHAERSRRASGNGRFAGRVYSGVGPATGLRNGMERTKPYRASSQRICRSRRRMSMLCTPI